MLFFRLFDIGVDGRECPENALLRTVPDRLVESRWMILLLGRELAQGSRSNVHESVYWQEE